MIQTFKRRNDPEIDRIEWDSETEIATYFYKDGRKPQGSYFAQDRVRDLCTEGRWIPALLSGKIEAARAWYADLREEEKEFINILLIHGRG